MSRNIGVAIIGSGIGISHLECILGINGLDGVIPSFVGIAKGSEDTSPIRRKFNQDLVRDNQIYIGNQRTSELISRPDVSLVIVASKDEMHYGHADAALFYGKNVLVEKPLTPGLSGAELVETAEQKNLLLDTATQARIHGADLIDILRANSDVRSIEICYILPSKCRVGMHHAIDNILPHVLSMLAPNLKLRSVGKDENYVFEFCMQDLREISVTVRIGYTEKPTTERTVVFNPNSKFPQERRFKAVMSDGVYYEQWLRLGNGYHRNPRQQLLEQTLLHLSDPVYKAQAYRRVLAEHNTLMAVKEAARASGIY